MVEGIVVSVVFAPMSIDDDDDWASMFVSEAAVAAVPAGVVDDSALVESAVPASSAPWFIVTSFESDAPGANTAVAPAPPGVEGAVADSAFVAVAPAVVEAGLDALASDSPCFSWMALWATANATDTLARMVIALAAEGNRAGGSGDKSGLGGGSCDSGSVLQISDHLAKYDKRPWRRAWYFGKSGSVARLLV